MPDRVISNTSPLFYFHRLRHLDLLQKLYQRIIVSQAGVGLRKLSPIYFTIIAGERP